MNQEKHKYYMAKILSQIFKDKYLCQHLAFKGGTALMFFYDLPRFSTDLDFNIIHDNQEEEVYDRMKTLLKPYGKIDDEAIKWYGPILVLDYGQGERKLKVELSNRHYDNHYEIKNMAGTDIRIMQLSDMFAHKLCALKERLSPRDVFDCHFFLQNHTKVNPHIILSRSGLSVPEHAFECAKIVSSASPKLMMQGLGEVVDRKTKSYIKNELLSQTAELLELFANFPFYSNEPPLIRTTILEANIKYVRLLEQNDIDISTLNEETVSVLFEQQQEVSIHTKSGKKVVCRLQNGEMVVSRF